MIRITERHSMGGGSGIMIPKELRENASLAKHMLGLAQRKDVNKAALRANEVAKANMIDSSAPTNVSNNDVLASYVNSGANAAVAGQSALENGIAEKNASIMNASQGVQQANQAIAQATLSQHMQNKSLENSMMSRMGGGGSRRVIGGKPSGQGLVDTGGGSGGGGGGGSNADTSGMTDHGNGIYSDGKRGYTHDANGDLQRIRGVVGVDGKWAPRSYNKGKWGI